MKVYPLIYSRTKFSDYVPGFLVRPKDIDYSLASEYVGQALEEVKHVKGIRHAFFSVGEYLIYGGIACISSVLVDRILQEQGIRELDYEYKDYQDDKAGRPLTFFIGFGVRRSDISGVDHIPKIDLYTTYKTYLDYLKQQWTELNTKTQFGEPIDVDIIRYTENFKPKIVEFNGKNFVENFDERKYQQVINYFFHQSVRDSNKDYSFLSNVMSDTVANCTKYKNISIYDKTVKSYIDNYELPIKLTANTLSKNEIDVNKEMFDESKEAIIRSVVKDNKGSKKKSTDCSVCRILIGVGVGVALTIAVVVFVILIKNMPKNKSQNATRESHQESQNVETNAAKKMSYMEVGMEQKNVSPVSMTKVVQKNVHAMEIADNKI